MTTATPTAPRRSAPPEPRPAIDRPQQAAELELLGRFEDSGFKDPPYLARRHDGQIVQLSRLLHLVADAANGRRDAEAIAARVGPRIGRRVSADNITFLVERKLRPLGVLAAADGSTPVLPKRPALLALRHRRPLLRPRVVRALGRTFAPLFGPPVIAMVLVALAVFDAWLFGVHGVAPGLRTVLYEPTLLLGLVVCVIAATAFHEIGHAAACRYGGAQPGAIGAGLYIVWPAFYCDVTDAYRLSRRGRLRTDLGGIYFNGIVSLLAGGAYFATGHEPLLLLAVVQHITMVQQLLPLLRFDGYYVLSDLTGVPDILSRIGPILRSLVPFRPAEPKVRELRPRVRVAVTLYVALLVPVLAAMLSWMVIGAPRVLATAVDSAGMHVARVSETFRRAEWSVSALECLQIAALVLQCAGMALVMGRTAKSGVRGLKRWSSGSVPRKVVAAAVCGGVLCALATMWWPNGEYRPLLPGERGTIPDAIAAIPTVSDARLPFHGADGTALVAHGSRLGSAPAIREGAGVPVPKPRETRPSAAGAPVVSPRSHDRPSRLTGDDPSVEPASPPDGTPTTTPTVPAPGSSPAPGPSPSPEQTATPSPKDNAAVATNTQDGSLVFRLAFDLQFILGGDLDQSNTAIADASCVGCRTIAVAIQVLIATGDFGVAAPTNLAVALNEVCPTCETLAYAYQLVLTTPELRILTEQGRRKIGEILAAIVILGSSDMPAEQLRTNLDALMVGLRGVVATELVPAAPAQDTSSTPTPDSGQTPAAVTPPTEATQSPAADQTPTPTSTSTPAPTSTPTPTVTSTPTATPTPDASPSPTPEATPTPTATSTPEPSATATPTP